MTPLSANAAARVVSEPWRLMMSVFVDLVYCSLYGHCEQQRAQRVPLFDSHTRATDIAVDAVEQLRVLAVGDDDPPHKLRAVSEETPRAY